jgi:hypothetical protein
MGMHTHDIPPEGVFVWKSLPKWHPALRPALLWVACPGCGYPHRTWFGPLDLDERKAEVEFLRGEIDRLYRIMRAERDGRPRGFRALVEAWRR